MSHLPTFIPTNPTHHHCRSSITKKTISSSFFSLHSIRTSNSHMLVRKFHQKIPQIPISKKQAVNSLMFC
ncbi:hypothetical protein Leryth_013814 [Lithospermum erythrorhizon]|nr:hypothetical protein Leryth_013814 [Lithospermum erythrorhizon]